MSKEASENQPNIEHAQDEFDAAWNDDGNPSDKNAAAEDSPPDDFDDEAGNANASDDAPPEKDQAGHAGDESFESMEADAERLQQRIKSAEGRLKHQHNEKLASDVQRMRTELAEMKQQLLVDDPQKTAAEKRQAPKGEKKPDGFDDEEWNDFNGDFSSNADDNKKPAGDVTQKRIEALEQEIATRKRQEAVQQFEAPILTAHPDYKTILKEQADDLMAFVNGIDDPIKQQGALMVVEKGNAQQIISLVSDYKTWRDAKAGKPSTQQPNKPAPTTRNPTAAMAVASRGGSKPNINTNTSAGNKDDFDDAWDKAAVS